MLQLILELRDHYGIEPFVLLPEYHGENKSLKDHLIENNIPFKESFIHFFKKIDHSACSRWNAIVSYRRIKGLAKELLPYKFDLVHSNSSVIDFGGFLSRELGIKHIWHLRDFGNLDYSLNSVFGETYERLTYRNAESFIAISNSVKQHFCKTIDSSRIATIYNGVKLKPNEPLSSHQNSKVQFLCAGSYCDAKNQMEVLRAVDVLIKELRVYDFHVTIAGFGVEGQYAHQLKQFSKGHSIEEYVSILGEIDGIAELASTMDVGIMPSHNEAFGRVTVEYMLQNLAVIANDSGANVEIIEHGKSGLIYPHDDYRSLAVNMTRLIQDRSQMTTLASCGRQRANAHFLSEYNTKAIFELYQEVVQHSSYSQNTLSNCICRLILLFYSIRSYLSIRQHALLARLLR